MMQICKRTLSHQTVKTLVPKLPSYPQDNEIKLLKDGLKVIFQFHTEYKNATETAKPNYFQSLHEITSHECCETLHNLSEQQVTKSFIDKGIIQYIVIAKEDIQWCDWIIWSNTLRIWTQIELKSNADEPLFDENGLFVRLGTISTQEKLQRYLSKGIRLTKISKMVGLNRVKLLYIGKICPTSKRALYELSFNENIITNYTEII